MAPGRLPLGRRVYAIGDIHGCLAELRQLHAAIADDFVRNKPRSAVLVHLGDYIDFGPDSAGVIALLAAGPPVPGLRTINLMGDHERTALDALSGDGAAATDWLHTGGEAALRSWGISVDTPRAVRHRRLVTVEHRHLVASPRQLEHEVEADVAIAAGDEGAHGGGPCRGRYASKRSDRDGSQEERY